MDPAPLQRMFQAAVAGGPLALAAFLGLCVTYAAKAGIALSEARPSGVERNLSPLVAAERLGIPVRKLTRGRFTVYREICVPLEGQSRGYVVSERALDALLIRQRVSR